MCLLSLSFFFPKYNPGKQKPSSLNPLSPQGRIQHSEFSQDRVCSFDTSKVFISERVKVMSHMKEIKCALKSLVSWKSLVQPFQSICMHCQKGQEKVWEV